MRGRPLAAILVLVTTWIAVRDAQYQISKSPLIQVAEKYVVEKLGGIPTKLVLTNERLDKSYSAFSIKPRKIMIYPFNDTISSRIQIDRQRPPASNVWQQVASAPMPLTKSEDRKNVADRTKAKTSSFTSTFPEKKDFKRRLGFYGYSFWRAGNANGGFAPAGQYGGSQSGLIATYRLGDSQSSVALLGRITGSPSPLTQRELAVGLRWQPSASLPVSVSIEQRFREGAADTFALYVAGGKSDVKLPEKFKLDGFAQMGILSGKPRDLFFDANTHIERPLKRIGEITFSAGGGAWAGGQTGTARLDIGPSLLAEMPVGHARFRIAADWRFRVAGNAIPSNGPAITLSTGF